MNLELCHPELVEGLLGLCTSVHCSATVPAIHYKSGAEPCTKPHRVFQFYRAARGQKNIFSNNKNLYLLFPKLIVCLKNQKQQNILKKFMEELERSINNLQLNKGSKHYSWITLV